MSSLINTTFFVVSFLILGYVFSNPVEQKSLANDLISDICSVSNDPPGCDKALRSDPGSAKADLKGLGHISIVLSQKSATTTMKWIKALLNGGAGDRVAACKEFYEESMGFIGETESAFNSGDYKGMSYKASAAINGPIECDGGFEGAPNPEPLPLKKGNDDLVVLINAVLEICRRLLG